MFYPNFDRLYQRVSLGRLHVGCTEGVDALVVPLKTVHLWLAAGWASSGVSTGSACEVSPNAHGGVRFATVPLRT